VSTSVLVLMGMIGHFRAGPIWACVKIDDCYDPFLQVR
jgi:hypothetical protein